MENPKRYLFTPAEIKLISEYLGLPKNKKYESINEFKGNAFEKNPQPKKMLSQFSRK